MRCLLLLTLLLAAPTSAQVYVDASATGANNGSSWSNAFRDLQDALAVASAGDEVWVAEGVYTPHPSDRTVSFRIPEGVEVYGGFPSGGAPFAQREPEQFATVLSGDLAGNDGPGFQNYGENSHHVIFLDGVAAPITEATVIDGFAIRGGNADGTGFREDSGGGVFCDADASEAECSPSISNVAFAGNRATDSVFGGGGAFFVEGGGSAPRFTDVTFEQNLCTGTGGAVYARDADPAFTRVTFLDNEASDGGAVYAYIRSITTGGALVFTDVLFEGNTATSSGGAVELFPSLTGDSRSTFERVTFRSNSAPRGGAVYLNNGNSGTEASVFRYVTFEGNAATGGFGAGGAVELYVDDGADSTPAFIDTRFLGNTADRGGAVSISTDDGGDADPLFLNAFFAGNTAAGTNGWGGAVYLNGNDQGAAAPLFANNVFSGNAADQGGAVHARASDGTASPAFTSSTFSGNSAAQGGGLYGSGTPATLDLENSIVWNNTGGALTLSSASASLDHALVEGGCPAGATCSDVLAADPLFADPDGPDNTVGTLNDDLSLAAGSPAVGAGDAALLPADPFDLDGDGDTDEALPVDIAGGPRVVGSALDLGAYERGGGGAPVVSIQPLGPPVVLGPEGGTVSYTVSITNAGTQTQTFEAWVQLVAPDGSVVETEGPRAVTLAPGQSLERTRTTAVMASLPAGTYTLRLRAGAFPGDVLVEDAFSFEKSALAQLTVTVTTDEDEFGNAFGSSDEGCGLREAVEAVNTGEDFGGCEVEGTGTPALINVPAGLYSLERSGFSSNDNRNGDLDLFVSARVVGAGPLSTFVSADYDDGSDRLVEVHGDGATAVALEGLTLTGGDSSGDGGGVLARDADLTLTDVTVSDGEADEGGGVYVGNGDLVLTDTRVLDNAATAFSGAGGGVYLEGGTLTMTGSTVEGNTAGRGRPVPDDDDFAGDGGDGGGLFLSGDGPFTIEESRIADNTAGTGGSAFDGFPGDGGRGGGLFVEGGPVSVTSTVFEGNAGGTGGLAGKSDVDSSAGRGGDGGGLYASDLQVTLTEVAFRANAAGAGGNGNDNAAGRGGDGGGLALDGGALLFERSLVAGNTAGDGGDASDGELGGSGGDGGGLYLAGLSVAEITDVTVSGNTAGDGQSSSFRTPGDGGGLYAVSALELQSVTITQNTVPADAEGGGLFLAGSLGFRAYQNTIVAGNTVGGDLDDPAANCATEFLNDQGFNVVGPGCPASAPSTVTVQPQDVFTTVLDPDLADNGGPTQTHALVLSASNPALDIGGDCEPVDQRGAPAPQDGPDADAEAECDAGAVEAGEATVAPITLSVEPVNPPVVVPASGGTFTFTVTLSNPAQAAQTFEAWSEAVLPNGNTFGPLVGPVTVTLGPGATLSRTLTQTVPASAPSGFYTYRVNAGTFPDDVVTSDAFAVVKQSGATEDTEPPSTEGWTVTDAETGRPVMAGARWEAGGAAARVALPEAFALHAAYPNPLVSRATVGYDLPEPEAVRLVVYDVLGRAVAVLVDERREAGSYEAVFDGSALSSGTYLVRFTAGDFVETRRLTLVR